MTVGLRLVEAGLMPIVKRRRLRYDGWVMIRRRAPSRFSPLPLLAFATLLAVTPVRADEMADGRAAFAAGDYASAFNAFRAAGEKGDATGAYLAAEMQLQGRGTPRDPQAALALMEKAAQQGHVRAMSALGAVYAYGRDVPADYPKALRLLKSAALAGDMHAQNNLATLLYFGLGGERNLSEALYWARRAAAQNLVAAIRLVAEITKEMTPEQVSAVNQRLSQPLQTELPAPAITQAPRSPVPSLPPSPATAAAAPVTPAAAPTAPAPAAKSVGSWAVQVAALPSQAEAESHWQGMRRRHAPLLEGRSPTWQQTQTPKGPFTRILLDGFADRAAAMEYCARLKAAGLDCLIRKPAD